MKKVLALLISAVLMVSLVSVALAEQPGFDADATIGVALPWVGTQNWAEASELFESNLAAAGFKPIVQHADNKAATQLQQIESMIENGAKVLVVGAVDSNQLGVVLEEAKAAGIYILGYDRLIENTAAVDGIVQSGSVETGRVQGRALLAGLAELKGEGPYNIELFGGGPLDPNAGNFFNGAMEILQPEIDAGKLVVVSGQADFNTCATADWDNATAQKRMDTLLSGFYADKEIAGVLCPNDGIARAIITASENAGQAIPVVSGLDCEDESVRWVVAGKQYSTVYKSSADMVNGTIDIIKGLQAGNGLPEPTGTAANGKIDVNLFELAPVAVTQANAAEVFANDAAKLAIVNEAK